MDNVRTSRVQVRGLRLRYLIDILYGVESQWFRVSMIPKGIMLFDLSCYYSETSLNKNDSVVISVVSERNIKLHTLLLLVFKDQGKEVHRR